MWLIRLSLGNPYLVAALVFGIALGGCLSAASIAIDILPVFRAPAVQVLTYYPGMPASAVEKTITNRIERWVNQAPGARLVESRSVPGVSVVKIYFRDDINPNEALTLTNSLALGALPNLPPNTLPPVALPFDATGTMPVGILTVSNRTMDDAIQKDVARIHVRNMLGAVPGCISPVVVGGQDRAVMVYLDPKKLDALSLAPMDIVGALRRGNLMVTPGTAYFGDNQVLLDSNSMAERVADLNEFPVTLGARQAILLKDVGRAEDSAMIQTSRVRIDGRNEVYVPIYRQQGASSLAVADGVRGRIPRMESRLPPETSLSLVMDQTVAVRSALMSVLEEGATGALLVSAMILLFLGNWRMTLIAVMSIPLAVLGAVLGLFATGNTINLMTLGGLALAIGPLVDDAIVELENNHRNYHMGKSRVRAALDGCAEVMVPVLVATCTTVIVLAPLAFLPGVGGFLFRPLTMAVGFAMLTSFILSRTFVPMMCARFLPGRHDSGALDHEGADFLGRLVEPFQRAVDSMTVAYGRALSWVLGRRMAALLAMAAIFSWAVSLVPGIGREFFPAVDSGQISMFVRAPTALRLDAAEKRIAEVEEFIRSAIPEAEREMIVTELGLNPDWSAAYTANSGQQDAVIRVQLTPGRKLSAQQHAARLRNLMDLEPKFADLRYSLDTGGMISTALNQGASSPIDIEIEGGTAEQSLELAGRIRSVAATVAGAADVRVQQRADARYLVIDIDRQKAALLGLTAEDVIRQVVVAMNSSVSVHRNFWIDSASGNQYFVGVQYPESPDRTIDDILGLPVKAPGQAGAVNLGTVATIRQREDAVEIHHSGLRRVANVLLNTEGRDIGAVAGELAGKLNEVEVPPGMHVNLKGEYARMGEAFASLATGLVLAALLVYLLQVSLFKSWSGPLVIMASVPLGFIGVVIMLRATATTFNVQSLMGMIFLVGIAVNNGVLLVDFANRRLKSTGDPAGAIHQAAITRFKPVLMTFLATVLALAPMDIGLGRGKEANVPLARAVVGGMISSTALTLFMVPVLYTFLSVPGNREDHVEAELARIDAEGTSHGS
ncbi:MAG: efflux RND transporter permease subunit [Planctomycetota bacterium]